MLLFVHKMIKGTSSLRVNIKTESKRLIRKIMNGILILVKKIIKKIKSFFDFEYDLKCQLDEINTLINKFNLSISNNDYKLIIKLKRYKIALKSMKRKTISTKITIFSGVILLFINILGFTFSRIADTANVVGIKNPSESFMHSFTEFAQWSSDNLFNLFGIYCIFLLVALIHDYLVIVRNRKIDCTIKLIDLELKNLKA